MPVHRLLSRAPVAAPVLVGIDDTDDAEGGCTTTVVLALLAAAPELALRGMPRLVRLNPNVPHKTRGNGAVCIELVVPEGARTTVGAWQGDAIDAYPDGRPVEADEAWADVLWKAVRAAARPGAEPGLVVCDEAPPEMLYWEAVRGRVEPDEARSMAAISRGERGVVGAAAACAWAGPATSYELIAYRHLARIGKPREVDGAALRALDADGTTFHSGDGDVTTCVPNTPCPVLAGLRGLEPERLVAGGLPALQQGEGMAGWLLFATNQASGDHVTPVAHLRDAPAWSTVEAALTVAVAPVTQRGGHVRVDAHDALGHPVVLWAFEPTKGFRDVVRGLRPGDRITAVGAAGDGLRLERLRVDVLADARVKSENPVCPQCHRRMKSRGRDAGYRCPEGHGDAPEEAAAHRIEERTLRPGWYEVPVAARRHLHRPLLLDLVPAASRA